MVTLATEHFLRFCADANIDHRQGGDSVRKYLLAYQRNLQHVPAFQTLFAGAFMNWDFVQRSLPRLDCAHWLALFRLIDFSKVPRDKSILKHIERHLLNMGLDRNLACPIFLLKNTHFVTAQVGVERLFSDHNVPDAYNQSLLFFAKSADEAFDLLEVTAVFCHVLQRCEIDEAELERQMQFVSLKEEELMASFKVKQIRMVGGRPRLRSKLKEISAEADSVANMCNFDKWCQKIGFPAVFAKPMRDKLYFLMAQPPALCPQDYVSAITRDVHVCKALEAVKDPDATVLHRAITSLKLVEEPFKELFAFRSECLGSFPLVQLNAMTFNDLVHLYVCAYQKAEVWTEVWKQIVPLLSHQVIRDVEAFTAKHPFNFKAVMKIMNSG